MCEYISAVNIITPQMLIPNLKSLLWHINFLPLLLFLSPTIEVCCSSLARRLVFIYCCTYLFSLHFFSLCL